MKEPEKEKPFEHLTPQWGLLAVLCSLPVYFLFLHLGDPGRARVAALGCATSLIAIRGRWDLRSYKWFWLVVVFVTILHIPLLFLIPWNDKSYPGITLMPIGMLDVGIYYGCIWIVEKVARKVPAS